MEPSAFSQRKERKRRSAGTHGASGKTSAEVAFRILEREDASGGGVLKRRKD